LAILIESLYRGGGGGGGEEEEIDAAKTERIKMSFKEI
jgi:hypothetical protein